MYSAEVLEESGRADKIFSAKSGAQGGRLTESKMFLDDV